VNHNQQPGGGRILAPGRNCWRLERASRVAFLVDGVAYFRALAAAIAHARHSILLLGWDFHSRIRLLRDGSLPDNEDTLIAHLERAVQRRRRLRIHILEWDFAMIYAAEREFLPLLRFGFQTHKRIHFRLDDRHPAGASHHQKLAVIDDGLAFAGGLDLAACRWDTPGHAAKDPRRSDPGFESYAPFHDVQAAVDGAAARALGELARQRWRAATGRRLSAPPAVDAVWPETLAVDVRDVDVAIARTAPAYGGRPEVREVEQLYLDAIRSARSHIYLENQYLTANSVGEALAERLREPDGPEIVAVLPQSCSGWLEELSMGVLRARLVERLRQADRHRRLRLLCPTLPGVPDSEYTLHSKLCVVDDRFLRLGSANLSNRSMGLDTECDLALECDGSGALAGAIAGLRNRLLGEHLNAPADRVAELLRERGSLIGAVEALRGSERTLRALDTAGLGWAEELVPASSLADPERPVDFAALKRQVLDDPGPEEGGGPSALRRVGSALLALVLLAAAWRWTPLSEWVTPERLGELATALREQPAGLFVAWLAFALASVVMVPVTALIVAYSLTFGWGLGAALAFSGAVLGAALTYALGRSLWRDTVRRLAGRRLNRLSERMARRGVLSVAMLRVVPVAPFTVVNLAAGASHIRFGDFLLGTALGMAPGTVALCLLADRAVAAVVAPGVASAIALGLVVAAVFGGGALLRRWLGAAAPEGE